MTKRTTLVQARISESAATQLDKDTVQLGFANRSEAVREAIRLLHREARMAELARDYDLFYGTNAEPPVSELVAVGDQIAADAMAVDRHSEKA